MIKTVFITLLIFQTFGIATLFSQSDEKECSSLVELKPLEPKIKEIIIKQIRNYIKQVETEDKSDMLITLYCPPTELYFSKNCDFPNRYENINFYLALLIEKPNSTLILKPNNDTISYNENPNSNFVRAETVKKIFMYFGIDGSRISIKDLKDEYPIGTNETDDGRKYNRYVSMNVVW